ncbi:MAG: SpoIID/LytB domain-containing protein [Phycisphaerales bacterium]|nr:SpoIID/LytB domain-containing protein [Phycisphaerales bacterium]
MTHQPGLFTDEPAPPDPPAASSADIGALPQPTISRTTGRLLGVALALAILAPALLIAACSWKSFSSGNGGFGPGAPNDPFYDPARHIGEPTIRVRIARAEPTITIDAQGPSTTTLLTVAPAFAPHLANTITAPIQVTLGPTAWRIIDGLGATRTIPRKDAGAAPPHADTLTIHAPMNTILSFDGAQRPGDIVLHALTDAPGAQSALAIDVVEHVPIELYLAGVVAKELYSSWHLETFKAQAIAARSYVLHERRRRAANDAYVDVEASTRNQAYIGHTTNRTALRAVEQTRGVVLTWQGQVLRAYYSSTVGGRAASAGDTWPTSAGFEFNAAGPIQASPRTDVDDFSPLYRWTVERSRDELSQRLRAWAQAQGSLLRQVQLVKRIEVSQRNEYQRPTRYRIYDDDDKWYELSAEALRVACNTSTQALPFPSNKQRINSSDFDVDTKSDTLVFRGRGFGHGVGMSQYGAEGMARAGLTADDILAHYYPGATLERAY